MNKTFEKYFKLREDGAPMQMAAQATDLNGGMPPAPNGDMGSGSSSGSGDSNKIMDILKLAADSYYDEVMDFLNNLSQKDDKIKAALEKSKSGVDDSLTPNATDAPDGNENQNQ